MSHLGNADLLSTTDSSYSCFYLGPNHDLTMIITIAIKRYDIYKQTIVSNIIQEKVGKLLETDSIKSKISSKTSHGKKDSTKRHYHRYHQRQPGEQ